MRLVPGGDAPLAARWLIKCSSGRPDASGKVLNSGERPAAPYSHDITLGVSGVGLLRVPRRGRARGGLVSNKSSDRVSDLKKVRRT